FAEAAALLARECNDRHGSAIGGSGGYRALHHGDDRTSRLARFRRRFGRVCDRRRDSGRLRVWRNHLACCGCRRILRAEAHRRTADRTRIALTLDASPRQADTCPMETFIWMGLLSFMTVGLALIVLDLITLLRSAGH